MNAKRILKKVERSYTVIAEEFDRTRHSAWPEFKILLSYLKSHITSNKSPISLLDAGCGNGRLYDFLRDKKLTYIGLDNNRALLKLARKNFPNAYFRYGDVLKLPFSASSFDTVWCIAVLHHIPTKTLHLKAIKEMKRVIKKNGLLMFTVWNLWQPKYRKYIDKKNHHSFIPWGASKKIKRYYYAFTLAELEQLLKKARFVVVKEVKKSHNFAFICKKM